MPSLPRLAAALLALALPFLAPAADSADSIPAADNEELARLHAEDQADRKPPPGKAIDWSIVGPRDDARLARVKQLYAADQLQTGRDYFHAAMVLQHGATPEDYLLAHELCVVAISKGYHRALWLAAASEDRFLRALGRPQRFGTQYRTPSDGPTQLQETDENVTDAHRRAMNAPSLAEAKARVSFFDGGKKYNEPPLADAPALTQDLFAATDDAGVALEKVRAVSPNNADDAFLVARACRDICARFPPAHIRAAAFAQAAIHWSRLSVDHLAQLSGWTPAQGEDDPEFTDEQRATLSQRLTYSRATNQAKAHGTIYEEALFDEMAAAARKHPSARQLRESLIDAALNVAPEKSIPRLRELWPDDPGVAAAIRLLEAIGQPLNLTLTTLDGRTVHTRDFRRKVVLIHFFAQRFGGSTSLVPSLQQLVARHGADRLALIGINTDNTPPSSEAIVQLGVSWPVHYDGSTDGKRIAMRLRARILPYYLLLDRAGNLRFRGINPTDPTASRRIEALLAEIGESTP